MSVIWTEEQQSVIDSRNQNLLVSAAAGSGKTAVLVEHILQMVTDPSNPIHVTELLVVTFTRAAAAEMKERLAEKLTERLEEEPWNVHVQRQIPLLSQAHISTIDSFCSWLVKNYFHLLDIDPDFRIADEGEDRLLREDVLQGVMDAAYEEDSPGFRHLLDAFGSSRGDREIRDLVLQLYRFADSFPWPQEWLHSIGRMEDGEQEVSLDEMPWAAVWFEDLKKELTEYTELYRQAVDRAEMAEGLEKYAEMFRQDLQTMERLVGADTPCRLLEALAGIEFVRKPIIRGKAPVDEAEKAALSALRDLLKSEVQDIAGRYAVDVEHQVEYLGRSRTDLRALVRLTLDFSESYRQEKMRRNLANFADVEHWALQLLIRKEGGQEVPTPLAAELGDTFREIIIDEYQDSNRIQEMILRTLSGEDRGHPNMFMVGDVKQSIYKFRMARPELFMEKYRLFKDAVGEKPGQRIDLKKNFRSRKWVLDSVNHVFDRIMGESLGGVEYDDRAALYYGASYPPEDPPVEILAMASDATGQDRILLEAKMVAARIHEIMDHPQDHPVWDGKKGCYRAPEFRDIVILLRTMEGWAGPFSRVLNQEGIPAYAQLSTGYFAAQEVQLLLHFLKMLDNPLQDISLAAVLLSPLGGFSMEELADQTVGEPPEQPLYRRLIEGAAAGKNTEKWDRFSEFLQYYRQESVHLSVHELLEEVLTGSGYREILAAQPGGQVRLANVDMLLERALQFEESSYRGIFQFLRYMDQLRKYEMDFGEAQVLSETENLVRITSIHKSKGLEYPVVFVSGAGKSFAFMDAYGAVLMHEDLGLACDYIDVEQRIRYPVLWKRCVADRLMADVRGEELRILYVAMTRAKEKLILTGVTSDWNKLTEKWFMAGDIPGKLPSYLIGKGNTYLDWLVMALAEYDLDQAQTPEGLCAGKENSFLVKVVSAADFEAQEARRMVSDRDRRRLWEQVMGQGVLDESYREELLELLSYHYPWEEICYRKPAVSVSELKHQAAMEYVENTIPGEVSPESADARESVLWAEPEGKVSPGAIRGTAYHNALEYIPPADGCDARSVDGHLADMVRKGLLTEEERQMIRIPKITTYYRSYLGKVAADADARGKFYREQSFYTQISVTEIPGMKPPEGGEDSGAEEWEGSEGSEAEKWEGGEGSGAEEWVLVQGIIDAFAEDADGQLILWDYKTDAVPRTGGRERLLGLYREQLLRYKDALEKARGQRVKEVWIYSFALEETIPVPVEP